MSDYCDEIKEIFDKPGMGVSLLRADEKNYILPKDKKLEGYGGCIIDFYKRGVRMETVKRLVEDGDYDAGENAVTASLGSIDVKLKSWRGREGKAGFQKDTPSIEFEGEVAFTFLPIYGQKWCTIDVGRNKYKVINIKQTHPHQAYSVSSVHFHFDGEVDDTEENREALKEDIQHIFNQVMSCEDMLIEGFERLKEESEEKRGGKQK